MNSNIIREPSVYLISKPSVDIAVLQEFLDDNDFIWNYSDRQECPSELIVETAGRLCYLSYGTGRNSKEEYIEHIIKSRHGSVLEHASWGFIFTGISRSLTHELVRHRAGMAYSQLSQRYVDESKARFVMPPAIQGNVEEEAIWIQEVREDLKNYIERVERMMEWDSYKKIQNKTERRKSVREAARSNLPNATETMIFATGNARALRNLIELRVSANAEAEIRRLQKKVFDILCVEAPNIFGDYELHLLKDGSWEVRTAYIKV